MVDATDSLKVDADDLVVVTDFFGDDLELPAGDGTEVDDGITGAEQTRVAVELLQFVG